MEPKKNPKKDLSKNSSIYFAAGMALVLSLTYVALEWKTFYGNTEYDVSMNTQDELIEEVPIVDWKTPPPPPPPVAPVVIEIIPDEKDVPETIIETSEPDEEKIYEISDIPDIEILEDVDVPFILVEDAPIFPGCEKASDKKACFQTMMTKHIRKNFRYPEIAQEMNIQGKVHTTFIIQKDGSIGGVRMRGPDKNLEKEASRILSKLPKMIPGKQRGNAVRVPFSIPITFKLQ